MARSSDLGAVELFASRTGGIEELRGLKFRRCSVEACSESAGGNVNGR